VAGHHHGERVSPPPLSKTLKRSSPVVGNHHKPSPVHSSRSDQRSRSPFGGTKGHGQRVSPPRSPAGRSSGSSRSRRHHEDNGQRVSPPRSVSGRNQAMELSSFRRDRRDVTRNESPPNKASTEWVRSSAIFCFLIKCESADSVFSRQRRTLKPNIAWVRVSRQHCLLLGSKKSTELVQSSEIVCLIKCISFDSLFPGKGGS
jgi:hypothetical protein